MRHLLDIQSLGLQEIVSVLEMAKGFKSLEIPLPPLGKGEKNLSCLFFEASTRTSLSFMVAGRKLGMDVWDFRGDGSSKVKGETDLDSCLNVYAIAKPDVMVIRHVDDQMANTVAAKLGCAVVNAGCGQGEHPTQALLDAFTLIEHFGKDDLSGRTVSIIGDIEHSRVAKSNVLCLTKLGAKVKVFGPHEMVPRQAQEWPVTVCRDMQEALSSIDAVMMLRVQKERLGFDFAGEAEYLRDFGLTWGRFEKLAPHVVVMHPGPMNRGVEIESPVADHRRSLILKQAENGVWVRMAVISSLLGQGRP